MGPLLALPLGEPARLGAILPKRIPITDVHADTLLKDVVGVGPRTAERLEGQGLVRVRDALFFLPLRYETYTPSAIGALSEGQSVCVNASVGASRVRFAGRGRRVLEVSLSDDTGTMACRFFRFRQTMADQFSPGMRIFASGTVSAWGKQLQMVHPSITVDAGDAPSEISGPRPVYSSIEGIPKKKLADLLGALAQSVAPKLKDSVPKHILLKLNLPALSEAVLAVHHPVDATGDVLENMTKRMAFDAFLAWSLKTLAARDSDKDRGLVHQSPVKAEALAEQMFPFVLTPGQKHAVFTLEKALASPEPMHCLLQGDVGCGKTAAALMAAALVAKAGRQSVLLSPTEVLAQQHMQSATRFLARAGVRSALLTGATPAPARRALLRALLAGDVDLLIGTHAVLEEDVRFARLGLAVVDEQHRFGVMHRQTLVGKGEGGLADLLVMTATPIPRSLAHALYGDLDLMVIEDKPPGRAGTQTRLFSAQQTDDVHDLVEQALKRGEQAYIVYPLIEASEKLEASALEEVRPMLEKRFGSYELAFLHGRMPSAKKVAVLKALMNRSVNILVSTTVIEVGVDVPGATVMVIHDADRFGLSQLHQLRGRVGRRDVAGLCCLVTKKSEPEVWERLSVLKESSDGFVVAERDLEFRGPGAFAGTEQSGFSDALMAQLCLYPSLLAEARALAEALIHQG